MPLTPEAKKLLAETIRGTQQDPEKGLRAKLLRAIHDEAERRYRLSVPIQDAGLDEAHTRYRERIEAWVAERLRGANSSGAAGRKSARRKADVAATQQRLLAQAEKEAAATCLNRLVFLRHVEALGLSRPAILGGGWNSRSYREFREFAPALCTNGTTDATEGYATLLQLVFDELAVELPGLFGDVGLTRLFPVPAATLRELVERLDNPELASAWTDETTLGWVYQYWNDPDREALDAKIKRGEKIAPHEIASKTQMFTERYMVEWLLQNSLGLTWLCMCKKHGWTPDVEDTLIDLDRRRAEWRTKRDAGEVPLDALMPVTGELEEHWKYFVPQPLPDDAIENAPESVRSIKLIDPACGSGHFLVIAFGMLAALYREEAKHRGASITDPEIAESILENNLHGIDIDPRAIQLAAAGLYLRAKAFAKVCRPKRVNLVAPVRQLGNLPADDPAVALLEKELKHEVGIPEELTKRLLSALAGVDYLGSLLKVDAALDDALRSVELELELERTHGPRDFLSGFPAQQVKLSIGEAKATILDRLERFLARRSKSEDLGLRLDGEQLAAGVRFVRMAREGAYDLVLGNPPYQGISKTESFEYVAKTYPKGKENLYAAFLERSAQLLKPGGVSVLVTMRGWMFVGKFAELRKHLLETNDLRCIGDFDRGAFDEVPNEVLAVCAPVFLRAPHRIASSVAMQPTHLGDRSYDRERTGRKRAAVLAQVGRYEFDPRSFEVIEGEPIVYWWSKEFLGKYSVARKLGDTSPARAGAVTGNHTRFLRCRWELSHCACDDTSNDAPLRTSTKGWVRYVKGARGMCWIDPCDEVCDWRNNGLAIKTNAERRYGSYTRQIRNEHLYFQPGIAVAGIGAAFGARTYRWRAIFDNMAASVFPADIAETVCSMNTSLSRSIQALNSGLHFEINDVNRLPLFPVPDASSILAVLKREFGVAESHRECSVEFKRPGPSQWRAAQAWAQCAVDRADGEPLPSYEPELDPPIREARISFAMGIALGRFGREGLGILNTGAVGGLPHGMLFLASNESDEDSLVGRSTECAELRQAWRDDALDSNGRDKYLRTQFFEFHRRLYESRPIYFPLSSARKSFVAYVSIHRWQDDTLSVLLADYLVPAKRRLEGEADDLRIARASGQNKGKAERRYADVQKLLEEPNDFIAKVTDIAEKGPQPPDAETQPREVCARYVMDLDDGVIVNSAALWPLLEPQWKDPKKWWKELANARGKKDYDWSHVAARYFPTRVRAKCHEDPSLAVAHRCFWELHPVKAYAWELRLQDEIRPEFTIEEPGSDAARHRFLSECPGKAEELRANELRRRARKAAKSEGVDEIEPLFEYDEEEEAADA